MISSHLYNVVQICKTITPIKDRSLARSMKYNLPNWYFFFPFVFVEFLDQVGTVLYTSSGLVHVLYTVTMKHWSKLNRAKYISIFTLWTWRQHLRLLHYLTTINGFFFLWFLNIPFRSFFYFLKFFQFQFFSEKTILFISIKFNVCCLYKETTEEMRKQRCYKLL